MRTCARCGLPGHRYGTNDSTNSDPMACVNLLRGELEALREVIRRLGPHHNIDPKVVGDLLADEREKRR